MCYLPKTIIYYAADMRCVRRIITDAFCGLDEHILYVLSVKGKD